MKNPTKSNIQFSQINAEDINKEFLTKQSFDKSYENEIISIIGSWGTCKSTVKEILHDRLCKNTQNTIIVNP